MSSAIEPAIVLAAYAEPALSGRRVLFIGHANSVMSERLLERGARLVHVCDSDPVRIAEATAKNRSSNVSFSALADGHFALRDGAFDVCIVEDAGIADPVGLVKRIRRALTPRGVAILASANPDARVPLMPHRTGGVVSLDYYALYDAVKAEFEHVRMLGQAPFVGYVVADFAPEGTPEPSIDTAFLPSGAEEPELFIAVASQQPVDLDAFSVVQLPYRNVIAPAAAGDPEALRKARGAEQAARTKVSELEGEVNLLRQGIALRDQQLREAESKAMARDGEATGLRRDLENKVELLEKLDMKLVDLSKKLEEGPSPEEQQVTATEIDRLEKALVERGEQIRKLERDLRESERIGKELVRQLPQPPSESAVETQRKAAESELAQRLAKSEADLIATRWALEAALKKSPATPPQAH